MHPGEISLAHGGVLFLDELAEFPTGVLQTLRQPIERGYVRIVRVDGAFTFPVALSTACGEQSLPLRLFGRSRGSVSLFGIDGRALSVQASRALGRPHRPYDRRDPPRSAGDYRGC